MRRMKNHNDARCSFDGAELVCNRLRHQAIGLSIPVLVKRANIQTEAGCTEVITEDGSGIDNLSTGLPGKLYKAIAYRRINYWRFEQMVAVAIEHQ